MEVEDKVEFADVGEILVEDLDQELDVLEVGELVVIDIDAECEVEAGIPLVDDFVVAVLQEVGVLGVPHDDDPVHFRLDLDLFRLLVEDEPPGEPGLALSVLQQDEPDLVSTPPFQSINKQWKVPAPSSTSAPGSPPKRTSPSPSRCANSKPAPPSCASGRPPRPGRRPPRMPINPGLIGLLKRLGGRRSRKRRSLFLGIRWIDLST
jgi:hypothetical protein